MAVIAALLGDNACGGLEQRKYSVACMRNYQYLAGIEQLLSLSFVLAYACGGCNGSGGSSAAGNKYVADNVNLHQVRSAGNAQRNSGGDDYQVAVFQQISLNRLLYCMVDKVVGGGHALLCHQRDNAP